jgi:iron(III) transport system ATP-binding protein
MLTVTKLDKTYTSEQRTHQAVRGISFDTRKGEFYTLLGPSGCGKSTTLRCIAGLEKPEHGEISIGKEVVFSGFRKIFVPSHKRNLGMVFQSYAIWPHMTVFDNVAFPLVSGERKLSKGQIRERVTNALSLVKLDSLASQPAPLLSGGQQQRVALARALAHQPEVLLLDEPLSNLDAKLREEMRVQIRILTRRLDVTTIYVTHDQLEALQMSDRIAVMHDGRIVEEGTPKQIYLSPRTAYTAGFVGRVNFFEGSVNASQSEDNMARVETPIGALVCDVPEGSRYSGGEKVLVAVRPEGISISMDRPEEGVNVIHGVLEASMFAGDTQDCIVRVDHQEIQVKADPLTDLPANASVYLHLPPARCVIIRGLAG